MPKPFCRTCAETMLGPAVVEKARRIVNAAPPLRLEQAAHLRALFLSARAFRGPGEPQPKACGHHG